MGMVLYPPDVPGLLGVADGTCLSPRSGELDFFSGDLGGVGLGFNPSAV